MEWMKKVWAWLKKNWQWVLFPIGILSLLGRMLLNRKTTQVVPSELSEAASFENQVAQEAAAKSTEAEQVRDAEVDEVIKRHEQEVKVLTEEQQARVKELREDPEALNSFLLSVSQQVRSDE